MQIRVNETIYPCEKIVTHVQDYMWDMRDNVEVILQMRYSDAVSLFVDHLSFGQLLNEDTYVPFDEYSVAGPITDYRNGLLSVRMGKPTEAEIAKEKMERIVDIALPQLDDATALTVIEYYPEWQNETAYERDMRMRYADKLYRCVQPHTSQSDWTPDKTPALWVEVSIDEWSEWHQPAGAHDAYNVDDKCSYNGKHYICDINGNVYPPPTNWHEV